MDVKHHVYLLAYKKGQNQHKCSIKNRGRHLPVCVTCCCNLHLLQVVEQWPVMHSASFVHFWPAIFSGGKRTKYILFCIVGYMLHTLNIALLIHQESQEMPPQQTWRKREGDRRTDRNSRTEGDWVRERERENDRQTDRDRERDLQRQTDRPRDTDRQRFRDRVREGERDRMTDRQRHRERHRERERERERGMGWGGMGGGGLMLKHSLLNIRVCVEYRHSGVPASSGSVGEHALHARRGALFS